MEEIADMRVKTNIGAQIEKVETHTDMNQDTNMMNIEETTQKKG